MHIKQNPLRLIYRSVVVAAFAGVATFGLQAQQTASSAQSLFFIPPPSAATLLAANDTTEGIGYSSSAGAEETTSAETYISSSLASASLAANPSPQPPPRYGRRPVYADSSHNADGSNKYGFLAGVGFTLPTGNANSYLNPSYSFQLGGIRNFDKKVGVAVQFDWDNFGFTSSNLNNELALYNNLGADISSLGGNSHIWSFSIDPTYTLVDHDKFGAYAVVGVGFYHKIATFTTPELADTYYGPVEINGTFDHYTSNAPGFNGGFGLTYKPSRFGGEKFFAEARYVFVDNSQRTGLNINNYNTAFGTSYTGTDYYPANSNRTEYIPVKFGVRF